jgi:hypothetical protein
VGELKYVNPNATDQGWLWVRNATWVKVNVPAWLKVRVDGQKDGRTNFTFMEGTQRLEGVIGGAKGSVWTIESDTGLPTLVDNPQARHDEEGLIFIDFDDKVRILDEGFSMLVGKLWMGARSGEGSRGPYSVRVEVGDLPGLLAPGSDGWSALGIPDFPHDGYYAAKWDRLWFPIYTGAANIKALYNDERYLHCGKYSNGCLSVDPDNWDTIYEYLIHRRKGPTRVGAVHIRYTK